MLLAAAGIPKFFPKASPRRVVDIGFVATVIGIVVLISAMDVNASASIVTVPLILIGLGFGALASQLGSVTVSAVPDDQSPEVGGLQNTATQFGASLGTALAGSVMIAALTASFLSGIAQNPDVPKDLSSKASVQLAAGVPFVSDAQLESALQEAGIDQKTTQAVLDVNEQARVDGLRIGARAPRDRRRDRAVLHEEDPDPAAWDRRSGQRSLAERIAGFVVLAVDEARMSAPTTLEVRGHDHLED